MITAIESSIEKGVQYLASKQHKNGSFASTTTTNPENLQKGSKHKIVYPTALILACLSELKNTPKIQLIKSKGARYLFAQKHKDWSFNYWERTSKDSASFPHPNNLTDTFLALSTLYMHDPKHFGGGELAQIVKLLTQLEVAEGGPYKTWLTKTKAWETVDLGTNIHVAHFLSLIQINLPNLENLMRKHIAKKDFNSIHYHTEHPTIYLISKTVKSHDLKKYVTAKKHQLKNPTHVALTVSTLINLGISPQEIKPEIHYILKTQEQDGSWKSTPFGIERIRDKRKYYTGSQELTTALCLEALRKYQKVIEDKHNSPNQKHEEIKTEIITKIHKEFDALDKTLKTDAKISLEKLLISKMANQIMLLPQIFKETLNVPAKKLPKDLAVHLGIANVYGWIAYTIYDDVMDEEGSPKLLPLANILLRKLTTIFRETAPNKEFEKYVEVTLNKIDATNKKEIVYRKRNKPLKLNDLATRSFGHVLGPLAILYWCGFNKSTQEFEKMEKFFTNYLIAKQLNDDAHDWEKDLVKGHPTFVTEKLTQMASKTKEIQKLREIFWDEAILDICNQISHHSNAAEKALNQTTCLKNKQPLEEMLNPLKRAIEKTKEERTQALEFIKNF